MRDGLNGCMAGVSVETLRRDLPGPADLERRFGLWLALLGFAAATVRLARAVSRA